MMKSCSSCGETVLRTDCHRNRYGEFICRKCQAQGIKFTQRGRANQYVKSWLIRLLWLLAGILVFIVVYWWFGSTLT